MAMRQNLPGSSLAAGEMVSRRGSQSPEVRAATLPRRQSHWRVYRAAVPGSSLAVAPTGQRGSLVGQSANCAARGGRIFGKRPCLVPTFRLGTSYWIQVPAFRLRPMPSVLRYGISSCLIHKPEGWAGAGARRSRSALRQARQIRRSDRWGTVRELAGQRAQISALSTGGTVKKPLDFQDSRRDFPHAPYGNFLRLMTGIVLDCMRKSASRAVGYRAHLPDLISAAPW